MTSQGLEQRKRCSTGFEISVDLSAGLSLWVSHSPSGRGQNCLHSGNLFIKQNSSQENRETKGEKKKRVFFGRNITSKDFCVRFLKHFTIMLAAYTVYGGGSPLFTASAQIVDLNKIDIN